MKLGVYFVLWVLVLTSCQHKEYTPLQVINPILGDESWLQAHGRLPNGSESEQERISTHLRYVEALLRATDTGGLTTEQRQKRAQLLDHLVDYYERDLFPKNKKYPDGRRPCFIDDEGTICAVGYLIEQTLGRSKAEAINDHYQYATVEEMHLPDLEDWMKEYGVTARELGMIQPTYGYYRAYGNVYAAGGMHWNGGQNAYTGIRIGYLLQPKHTEQNWATRNGLAYDLWLNYRQWSVSGRSLELRLGTCRKLIHRSSINVGLGIEGWQNGSTHGSALIPSVQLTQYLFRLKKIGFDLAAAYGYHYNLSPSDGYPLSPNDLSILLRMNYTFVKFRYGA